MGLPLSHSQGPFPLTSEAKMEPPIQGLNLRSMVLLLAMSFSRMLWGERGAGGSRHLRSGKGQGWKWGSLGSHRRGGVGSGGLEALLPVGRRKGGVLKS